MSLNEEVCVVDTVHSIYQIVVIHFASELLRKVMSFVLCILNEIEKRRKQENEVEQDNEKGEPIPHVLPLGSEICPIALEEKEKEKTLFLIRARRTKRRKEDSSV